MTRDKFRILFADQWDISIHNSCQLQGPDRFNVPKTEFLNPRLTSRSSNRSRDPLYRIIFELSDYHDS